MKTNLPYSINTIEEAKAFLFDLHQNGESYHPEDDAFDIINAEQLPLFTIEEAEQLNNLFGEIANLSRGDHETLFDASEYLMSLDPLNDNSHDN